MTALPGPVPRYRSRYVWVWAGVWLVYMLRPVDDAWHRPHLWEKIVGVGAALTFCAIYLCGFVFLRTSLRVSGRRLWPVLGLPLVGVMAALSGLLMLAIGQSGLGSLVYVAVMAVFTLSDRLAWAVVAMLAAATSGLPRLVSGWRSNDDLTFSLLVAALAVWGVVSLIQRTAQLAAAREEITRLAVAEERNRFARDLHDLLGHSLTVVSVKAELASRLVQIAPARAEAEMADVQRLAREALTDVRAALSGYRELSLGAELALARSALAAAQIEADLPLSTEEVPADRQELFAWAVREGVTNVLRHSEAKRCRIRLSANGVEIVDDGHGPAEPAAPGPGNSNGNSTGTGTGHGLTGLRERASAAGGTLTAGQAAGGGFALCLSVPSPA